MLALDRLEESLDSRPESDARRRWAAYLFDESVVPAAAGDRRLGSFLWPDEFPRRAGVVVQTANERRIKLILDAVPLQRGLDLFEMLATLVAERVSDLRRFLERLENERVLDVEDTQRACRPF